MTLYHPDTLFRFIAALPQTKERRASVGSGAPLKLTIIDTGGRLETMTNEPSNPARAWLNTG